MNWIFSTFSKQFRSGAILFSLLILLAVAACSGVDFSEPSPIPPPPNLDEINTAVPEPNDISTNEPGATEEGNEAPIQPESTAVTEEEATNEPEPTPTLAPTAVPQTIPPIQNVSSVGLPPTSRDLVFIGDGALKLYTNGGQLTDLYPGGVPTGDEQREDIFSRFEGDVTHFDVSADGNRIVAARITRTETLTQTVEGSNDVVAQLYTEHEILFLDVVSKESWVLADNVTDLTTVKISPNQQTVAFIASGLESTPAPTFSNELPQQNVYTVLTPDRGNLRQISRCDNGCSALVWHPNSELFFYSDGAAMWLYNLTASQPESLLQNETDDVANFKLYAPLSFASNGRFLLVWDGVWEGGSYAVYDIPTQQIIRIPNTTVAATPFPTEVTWMPDTRLLVSRNSLSGGTWNTTIELWRVSVDEGVVNLEESSDPPQNGAAVSAINLENGRFAYALVSQNNPTDSGLYLQTSFNEPNERVNGMLTSFSAPTVVWSPDGFGAIFVKDGTPFYGQVNGSPINLTAEFGQFTHSFRWLPATAVNR